MTRPLATAAALAAGYLLGTVPSADVAGRLVAVDVRAAGTGNPGAANAAAVLGRHWGLAVAAVDVAKGWAATALGARVSPAVAQACGAAAVAGHVFPVWSGFRGGKGVATSYGMVVGGFPVYAVPDLAVAAVAARTLRSARRGNDVASVAWVAAAVVAWRRGAPAPWGPPPTAALPVASAAVAGLVAWRMRRPDLGAPPA